MWRTLSIMMLLAVLSLSACSSSDDGAAGTEAAQEVGAAPPDTDADPADDRATAPDATAADGPGFTTSTNDPIYVDLLLDCVFGENEAASCEQLEEAGLSGDDVYGLGNSLSQAPSSALREDCLGGAALSCAELNGRVDDAILGGGDEPRLLCLFHSSAREGGGSDLDLFQLQRLLGRDAPPGVVAAVDRLAVDNRDADSLETLTGYLDPICVSLLD